jgi:hypothetical protein
VCNASTYCVGLHREDGCTASEDGEFVFSWLSVEHSPARQTDDTSLDTLFTEVAGSLDGNGHLTTGTDDGQVFPFDLVHDIASLHRMFDGRILQLREVLSRQGDDGGCRLCLQGHEVCGRRLIAVSWTPEVGVGQGTEVGGRLDWLMGRSILSQTDGIVSSDPNDLVATESRQTNGTSSITDKVL